MAAILGKPKRINFDCGLVALAVATGQPYDLIRESRLEWWRYHGCNRTSGGTPNAFTREFLINNGFQISTWRNPENGSRKLKNLLPMYAKGKPGVVAKTVLLVGTFFVFSAEHVWTVKDGISYDQMLPVPVEKTMDKYANRIWRLRDSAVHLRISPEALNSLRKICQAGEWPSYVATLDQALYMTNLRTEGLTEAAHG